MLNVFIYLLVCLNHLLNIFKAIYSLLSLSLHYYLIFGAMVTNQFTCRGIN